MVRSIDFDNHETQEREPMIVDVRVVIDERRVGGFTLPRMPLTINHASFRTNHHHPFHDDHRQHHPSPKNIRFVFQPLLDSFLASDAATGGRWMCL